MESAQVPLPPERPQRYANAVLVDSASGVLPVSTPLQFGQTVRLRLDIGPLSAESAVVNPEAFPDKHLPSGTKQIDVLVSSTDFHVAGEEDHVAHGHFILPEDGSPAIAPDGGQYLHFALSAPQTRGRARCRIGYYFRNALVQSQILKADVGDGDGYRIETDFTLSRDLTGLEAIPDRPRLSILTNDNGSGTHQIVLRSEDPGAGSSRATTFEISSDKIDPLIKTLRETLEDRAPTTPSRSKDQLIADLRALAPIGNELRNRGVDQAAHLFVPLYQRPDNFVIQVSRPTSSGFTFPWAFVYDIPLDGEPAICPTLANWDGQSPLKGDGKGRCTQHHDKNVLCPFGFWGFAFAIEQLSRTNDIAVEIAVPEDFAFVIGETRRDVRPEDLKAHIDSLRQALKKTFPKAELQESADKASLQTLLGKDLPFVYFYCHGRNRYDGDPDTWLEIGDSDIVTADEFKNWVWNWVRSGTVVWDKTRPLVFLNACHSLAIYPKTLVSYLEAFVGTASASGVIGTEVRVNQALAMDVAQRFFTALLSGSTVEHALKDIRLSYLARGNLFGLVYTPYCWADLHLVRQ